MLKNPKGSPLSVFFRHCEIFSRKWKFLFSSIFSCFATEWMLKNLKGSSFSVFRHCETLARQGLALASPGAPLGFFWACNFFENFFFKKFRFSSTVKDYLTLGSLFAIFEPWIWRRLGPVPACSTNRNKSGSSVSIRGSNEHEISQKMKQKYTKSAKDINLDLNLAKTGLS